MFFHPAKVPSKVFKILFKVHWAYYVSSNKIFHLLPFQLIIQSVVDFQMRWHIDDFDLICKIVHLNMYVCICLIQKYIYMTLVKDLVSNKSIGKVISSKHDQSKNQYDGIFSQIQVFIIDLKILGLKVSLTLHGNLLKSFAPL